MRRLAALALLACCTGLLAPALADAQGGERLNPLVTLLAGGEAAFGPFANPKGADAAAQMGRNPNVDYIFYDMEHAPFDVNEMRTYLQFLLDPARLARRGRPGSEIAVLVRIPANGREMNQWMIKNVLDQGAHGIIAPHIETAEQALNVVRAMRYPQAEGAADVEPTGLRGSGAGNAARYWGISGGEYVRRADVWPLDPQGELVNMIQIENRLGVENVEAIARVPGVSMLMAAPADLGMAYGGNDEATESAIQTVLAAAQAAGLPCAITAGPNDAARRVREGFRVLIGGGAMNAAGREAAGR